MYFLFFGGKETKSDWNLIVISSRVKKRKKYVIYEIYLFFLCEKNKKRSTWAEKKVLISQQIFNTSESIATKICNGFRLRNLKTHTTSPARLIFVRRAWPPKKSVVFGPEKSWRCPLFQILMLTLLTRCWDECLQPNSSRLEINNPILPRPIEQLDSAKVQGSRLALGLELGPMRKFEFLPLLHLS